MRKNQLPLNNVKQTLGQMKRLAVQYAKDVSPYASMSVNEFYEKVKNIPYRFDLDSQGNLTEIVQRPLYTLNGQGFGGDCDDKAICMGAWAYLNGLPFRFKAVGKKLNGSLHHVFAEIYLNNEWLVCDATYPFNTLGQTLSNYQKVVVYG